MTTDTKASDYAAIVAQAEAAVAAVKDPELRTVAFDKILATLLDQQTVGPGSSGTKGKGSRVSKTPNAKPSRESKSQRGGPKAYVDTLINDGFFEKQRTIAEVKAELANGGHHIALTSLSGPLQALTQERRLRRQKKAANSKGTKTTYAYSKW
jgi:hypothetical protein